jgi:glycine dehydrogenase subunit 2
MNFGVDSGSYPLGSCTMKYNPRVNEDAARLSGFAGLHPYQPEDTVQGALELMVELADDLAEVAGLPAVTLQPAAGAHGELTALMCFRAYHVDRGDARKKVLIPDSAHGTNPATVSMCGYEVVTIPGDERGGVDMEA